LDLIDIRGSGLRLPVYVSWKIAGRSKEKAQGLHFGNAARVAVTILAAIVGSCCLS